ncbi:MAG TPA: hypothetical protein VII63_06720 [Caulobacteraceae bacterium]
MGAPAVPAAGAEHASGLPQFDVANWPGQIFWVLVVFAILYVLFARVFVPRIGGAIAAREDRISGEIGDARRLRDEALAQSGIAAGEVAQAKARARQLAEEATAKIRMQGQESRAEEDARLAEILLAAEAEIASARLRAMGNVRAIAEQTASAMVEKLTAAAPSEVELARAMARLTAGPV